MCDLLCISFAVGRVPPKQHAAAAAAAAATKTKGERLSGHDAVAARDAEVTVLAWHPELLLLAVAWADGA